MIPMPHGDHGSTISPTSVALIAPSDGRLELLVPPVSDAELTRSQLFLAAVAFRSTDRDWVEEQIDFIVEVRRQFDALEASQQIKKED